MLQYSFECGKTYPFGIGWQSSVDGTWGAGLSLTGNTGSSWGRPVPNSVQNLSHHYVLLLLLLLLVNSSVRTKDSRESTARVSETVATIR